MNSADYRCRPYISIVIPVRNEGRYVARALASIIDGRSHVFPLEIVIVDDASDDDCCSGLHKCSDPTRDVRVRVVRLNRWSGIPFARNTGARAASSDTLFITDGNVIFPPRWDAVIRRRMRPGLVLCATIGDTKSSFRGYGCTLLLPSMHARWIPRPGHFGGSVPIAPCSSTIISKDMFLRAGGYDTAMPVYGAAEPEFSVRLWLLGARILSCPDLVLMHRFRPPSERAPFLRHISAIELQNYIRFGLLYLDERHSLDMLRYYSERYPETFERGLRAVYAGDVWRRRDHLRASLKHPFDFYVSRFGLGAATRCAS